MMGIEAWMKIDQNSRVCKRSNMDSASHYYQTIPSVCCVFLGSLSHCSQPSGTCKTRKLSPHQNSTHPLVKHNTYAFNFSCSKEGNNCYSVPSTSQFLKNFQILYSVGKRPVTKLFVLKRPKGFGPVLGKKKKKKIMTKEEVEQEEEEEEEDMVIPEIVTNRMMKRIGLSVGVPLAIGIPFFPFFYYLKVILKWDVPDWLPFVISTFTFGSAALGITYGIMSTSWDPLREGSFLGWTEAQKNWPVFWQSVQGRGGKK